MTKLCEAEVKRNLVLAELGEPLTLPLARLNNNCRFRREWMRIQRKWHGLTKEARIKMKKYNKEYSRRPEVRVKQLERQRTPEARATQKIWRENNPGYDKEYSKRPEVIRRNKNRMKEEKQ